MQFAQSMMGGGSSGGGQSEWGDLAKLGQMATAAGGGDHSKAEPSGLMSMLGGGGGGGGGGGMANQAMGMMGGGGGGGAKAGDVDTGVLQKLVGVFNKETGTQYNPDDEGHNNIMSSIASKVTGTNMPPSLVSKLIKWKLQGMF